MVFLISSSLKQGKINDIWVDNYLITNMIELYFSLFYDFSYKLFIPDFGEGTYEINQKTYHQ